jgi:hypothetical protein
VTAPGVDKQNMLELPCGDLFEAVDVELWRTEHLPACSICLGNFGECPFAPQGTHLFVGPGGPQSTCFWCGDARVPKRIQMSRQTPWRAENPDAVIVDRTTMWGNPILMSDVAAQYPSLDLEGVAGMVVANFRDLVRAGRISLPNWRFAGGERGPITWTYPSIAEIRTHLAGRDLACWCPLTSACHGDVLLEIANERSE